MNLKSAIRDPCGYFEEIKVLSETGSGFHRLLQQVDFRMGTGSKTRIEENVRKLCLPTTGRVPHFTLIAATGAFREMSHGFVGVI